MWHKLVPKVVTLVVGKTMHAYSEDFQFGVGTQWGGEAILHFVNRLIECKGDLVCIYMLFMDFQNAFNRVDKSVV